MTDQLEVPALPDRYPASWWQLEGQVLSQAQSPPRLEAALMPSPTSPRLAVPAPLTCHPGGLPVPETPVAHEHALAQFVPNGALLRERGARDRGTSRDEDPAHAFRHVALLSRGWLPRGLDVRVRGCDLGALARGSIRRL